MRLLGGAGVFDSKDRNSSFQGGIGEREEKRNKPEVSVLLPGMRRSRVTHESDCRALLTFLTANWIQLGP